VLFLDGTAVSAAIAALLFLENKECCWRWWWCMLYRYTRQSMHTRLSRRKTRTEWICALSAVWHQLPE